VTKVFFYNGATALATVTTAPYVYSWSNVAAGVYNITAKATDNKNAVSTSAVRTVTVAANVAPTVTVSSPANGASFAAPATIVLTATAADSDGTVSKVDFYQGTTLVGTATTAPYAFSWANVALGNYSVTAKATDNKGAVTTSATVAVTVKVNSAPAVSITAPTANAVFLSPATISIAAAANDSDGTISKVEFFSGGTLVGTANTPPYVFNWTGVPAGTYALKAEAVDDKGARTTSAEVPITVRTNAAPSVNVTSPVNNASYVAPASILLSAAVADSDGTVSKVEFYSGAILIGTSTVAPYSVSWSGVVAGSYNIAAKATDNDGGTTMSASVTVNVANNLAPTVSLTATPSSAIAPATITLDATAADSDGSIATVEFFSDGYLLATTTQAPYAFTWTNVAAGSHAVTARATDNLGSTATTTALQVIVGAGAAQVYYVYADQVDAAREITNAAGTVVWRADTSEPFGANLPNENPSGLGQFTYELRFPGQYYDRETGLHYNYFRTYDPLTGRYMESDPIGLEGGVNTFVYVGADPISRADPTGLIWPKDLYDCIKSTREFEKDQNECVKEFQRCDGDIRKEIQFIEKYGGGGLTSAVHNCAIARNPGLYKKMITSCGKTAASPAGPFPLKPK
jgi:RHS repeat-associated protein